MTHLYPKVKRYVVYTSLRINISQHAFGFLGTFNMNLNVKNPNSKAKFRILEFISTIAFFWVSNPRLGCEI